MAGAPGPAHVKPPMADPVTSSPEDAHDSLGPQETARLTELARACKAAARAVVLYPAAHPAIAATLGRIAALTAPAAMPASLRLTVLPDALLLDDRKPALTSPARRAVGAAPDAARHAVRWSRQGGPTGRGG